MTIGVKNGYKKHSWSFQWQYRSGGNVIEKPSIFIKTIVEISPTVSDQKIASKLAGKSYSSKSRNC